MPSISARHSGSAVPGRLVRIVRALDLVGDLVDEEAADEGGHRRHQEQRAGDDAERGRDRQHPGEDLPGGVPAGGRLRPRWRRRSPSRRTPGSARCRSARSGCRPSPIDLSSTRRNGGENIWTSALMAASNIESSATGQRYVGAGLDSWAKMRQCAAQSKARRRTSARPKLPRARRTPLPPRASSVCGRCAQAIRR